MSKPTVAIVCLCLGVTASFASITAAQNTPPSLDELTITVTPDHPREFIFTDKGAAHLAGEAVGPDNRSYHGFYIAMHEVMDGWSLRLEDGSMIGPQTSVAADIRPDRMLRRHRLADASEVTETVTLFDRANAFRVVYSGVPAGAFAVIPRIDMRFLWKVSRPAYDVRWRDGVLLVARQDQVSRPPDPDHPAWLAIAVTGAEDFEPDGRHLNVDYSKSAARKAMEHASPYLPGAIRGRIPARVHSGRVEMVCAAAATATEAIARVRDLRGRALDLEAERRHRLSDLLAHSCIRTGVDEDDRALAWARVSLDNLIMEQRGLGMYAGFYWFTTYWGRDTFISLPGACISIGDFETARTLLRAFSEFQNRDPSGEREGRVPNFVTVEQVQYAGVDGTWWFVRALDELWRASGDDAFAAEMAPVVFLAVNGALRHATDDEYFLRHGDGETWMDAGGEANPFSPRGDRAVEVQALWHRGLLTAARLAEKFPSAQTDPAELRSIAGALAANFRDRFFVAGRLVDHLNPDDTPDLQIRPNGLLALLASPTLFGAEEQRAATTEAGRHLVMPWGVLSLAQGDPAFHPKHLDLAEYYYDEAYHNGDIWLWLSGAWVSALNDPRDAFEQTRMLLDEILHEGAVGTLQEIRDGAKALSNDEFGGATSQAWSLAELLRNVVDDYLGLEADLTADPPRIEVRASLPAAWPHLSVRTRLGEHDCLFICRDGTVALEAVPPLPKQWSVSLEMCDE